MPADALLSQLRRLGLLAAGDVHVEPLAGGVSGDIFLVAQNGHRFVVKQALAKLRVKDDWFADVGRNRYEQEYLRYVGEFLPHAVPKVLASDAAQGFFVMEYLGEGYANWKSLLLGGAAQTSHAQWAGRILGEIHARSWKDPEAQALFATARNFHELRIEPYLLTTGTRHPHLRTWFEAEATRLEKASLCLVHGDFSPKNILIRKDRMVVLDCEVAWFGDPAFDVAFLLNHLFLKSLHLLGQRDDFLALGAGFELAYLEALGAERSAEVARHVPRLLLMLLLARVDGKSPAEYLTDPRKREFIRRFVAGNLPAPPSTLPQLQQLWSESLAVFASSNA